MTHRISTTILLLASLLFSVSLSAKQRTFAEARIIAERQATTLGVALTSTAVETARRLNASAQHGGQPAYYVFPYGENKGFVIVSGDDLMPDIVAYSSQGSYDPTCLPDGYKDFLAQYAQMIEALQQGDPVVTQLVAESRAQRAAKASRAKVSPLLGGRKWNQYAPFNDQCPMDGSQRSLTGCVATALAQVFAYWRHPTALKADIPAYTTNTKGISVPAISAGEPYDWDNMLDEYVSGQYNQTQADAVAQLMLHCGAALQMDYTSSSSGTSIYTSRLAKYFGYDSQTMQEVRRADYTLSDWMDLLDAELSAKRPILYRGQSSTTGHQFVCDGADGDGLYHINWGWGGHNDGYYDITLLNPGTGGAGSGTGTDGYSQECAAVIGIQPGSGDAPVDRWVLVSATTNAAEGLYETEKAEMYNYHVKVPKTTDGEAIFTYGIQNNGETASLEYALSITSFPNRETNYQLQTATFPGNGTVTYVSINAVPADFGGDRTISCIFGAYPEGTYEYLPTTMDEWKMFIVDPDKAGYSFRMGPEEQVLYVAGDTPSAIEEVGTASVCPAYGGVGELVLVGNSTDNVPVYGVDGRKVVDVPVAAGSEVRVPLKAGVYVVSGRKVLVK